ncbi:major facilitator superfamily domain-containing protein, partial [Xylariales sp. PMI_506]
MPEAETPDVKPSLGPNERSPLLGEPDGGREHGAEDDQREDEAGRPTENLSSSRLVRIIFVILMFVLLEGTSNLQGIPINQILEDIICRNVRAGLRPGGASESCGDDPDVQGELALLKGWQSTLDLLAGVIAAIPFGFLADKYGRKLVLSIAILGAFLSQAFYIIVCWWPDIFPVRLTWLSAAFLLIGGGSVVLTGTFFSLLADLSPEAYRTNIFLFAGGAIASSVFISSSVAVVLMKIDPWLPVFVAIAVFIPVLAIALWLPETLDVKKTRDTPSHPDTIGSQATSTLWGELVRGLQKVQSSVMFFFNAQRDAALLLSTMLLTIVGRHAMDVIMQFARKKFGWTWAKAGLLTSLRAFVVTIVMFVLLPSISSAFGRWTSYSPKERDLRLARTCCGFFILGAVIIGLSVNSAMFIIGIIIITLGSPYNFLIRSTLSIIIDQRHRTLMFNAVGVLESLGGIVSGPILAAAFRLGLRLDGMWISLPFFLS